MRPSSIDVIASALQDSAAPQPTEVSSPDGAITLLFCELADIDSVRAALSDEAMDELLRDQGAIVANIANLHAGAIARDHDDGFLITFESAHAALRCAIELQNAFAPMTRDAISLRVGVHTGFVIGENENLYGRNVVLGARIAGQAAGGEIIVSAKVREYTGTDPTFSFISRGEHHFKGLHGEHELFALDWRSRAAFPA
jgi:adenylate cyclase